MVGVHSHMLKGSSSTAFATRPMRVPHFKLVLIGNLVLSSSMLLGLFKNVTKCVPDPLKVVQFWRIQHGYHNVFWRDRPI